MSGTSLKILAIDDDPADQELLRRFLEDVPGYRIELECLTGLEESFDEDVARPVDVIFLDYLLGRDNGLNKLQNLRARGVKTPVVILTGQGDEGLVVDLMRAGATDYLAKARLSPDNLARVLRNAIRVGELERQAAVSQENLRLAAKVFENVLEGVMVTDAHASVLSVNPAFTSITGFSTEEIVGKNPNILRSKFHSAEFFQNMWGLLSTSGQWRGEIWNKRKSGDVFLAWQTISAVRNDAGKITHYVSVLFDITERKRHEELVRYQAYHDVLTGLPNRQLFHDRLTQGLLHARREGEMLGVMFLDLDHFKEINDTLGHDAGDQLLREVASRLKVSVRKGDTVARLGGDEFVLLLPKIKQIDNLTFLAAKVLESMRTPIKLAAGEFTVTTSIGISVYPRDGDKPDMLIKQADEAMYRAKQDGRNSFQMASN
ncbi:MAG: diguanylate cyclase [Sulfuricella sp.]|nr:diguanylate cyclase [Sulfuricella sp.]